MSNERITAGMLVRLAGPGAIIYASVERLSHHRDYSVAGYDLIRYVGLVLQTDVGRSGNPDTMWHRTVFHGASASVYTRDTMCGIVHDCMLVPL